ncbi:MAG: hypothetical protein IPK78_17680 [Rhodospirillales bacterium]|nr:hypothetical protein [Rhodospirillales bacterium]
MRPEVAEILQQLNVLLGRLADVLGDDGGSAGKWPLSPVGKGASVLADDDRADRVYYAPPATYRTKEGVTSCAAAPVSRPWAT